MKLMGKYNNSKEKAINLVIDIEKKQLAKCIICIKLFIERHYYLIFNFEN